MRMCTKTQALELQNKNKEAVLLFGIFFKKIVVFITCKKSPCHQKTGDWEFATHGRNELNTASFQDTRTV